MKATAKQKRKVKALIAGVVVPETFDEASRLIVGLRREHLPLPSQEVIEAIHTALEEGDKSDLARTLRRAKARTRHGYWLSLLDELGITPRQAQRIMRNS